jgi:hypothetical protein
MNSWSGEGAPAQGVNKAINPGGCLAREPPGFPAGWVSLEAPRESGSAPRDARPASPERR